MRAVEAWVLGYLLNALWQVPVVFAAAWLMARLLRRTGSAAAWEHRAWVAAMLAEAVLPGCRFPVANAWHWIWRGSPSGGEVSVTLGPGLTAGTGIRVTDEVLGAIALVYGCGVLYFGGRLAWRLWRTHQLEQCAQQVVLAGEAAAIWQECTRRFGLRQVALAACEGIAGPVTVGVARGLMLVPHGFLAKVAPGDLKAAVAHEFAHMRRHDFLKNLLYAVATLPVAFHPAMWLTRSRMEESREMVCDELAAEAVAGRETYARSLLRLASLLVRERPARGLHAIGLFDANLFERRVMNLTRMEVQKKGAARLAVLAACVAIAIATCGSALALRLESPVEGQETATVPETHAPAKVAGGVMAGQALAKVNPVYPPEAKKAKIQGAVVMKAVISREGAVENLQVVSGPKELQASALDSVRQWTYKPYLLNGEPVEVETTVTVTYSLSK